MKFPVKQCQICRYFSVAPSSNDSYFQPLEQIWLQLKYFMCKVLRQYREISFLC